MNKPINRVKAALLLQGGEKEHKKLFTRIWRYFYPRLMIYIRNIKLADPGEDVVQEILAKVWMNLASYNPIFSLSTWIYTIAKNHIRDMNKKKRISCTTLNSRKEDTLIDTKNLSPEDIYFQQHIKDNIARFLSSLDESNREILYLRFFEHLKIKNIAAIMNIPVGTIKYRIHMLKQKLSIFLEDDYEKESN